MNQGRRWREAAMATSGDKGFLTLLRDEAHFPASSKIGTALAHSRSTFYCFSSYILMTAQVGVSALKSSSYPWMCTCVTFRTRGCLKPNRVGISFVQSRAPSGAAGNERGKHRTPAARDSGDVLYLPIFNSRVRCVHCSTHGGWQIESFPEQRWDGAPSGESRA